MIMTPEEAADIATRPPTHSVIVGYLVWVFGFLGAHRFYYGKPITGTIWFFTLGVFGIGWVIDAFLIPSMERDAARHFSRGRYDYTIAWALLTFVGVLGLHRFYLGKIFTGLLYLFTAGFLGLGILYDFWTLNNNISMLNNNISMLNGADRAS
jgi:TM2 domain-containing membrane protein YozV